MRHDRYCIGGHDLDHKFRPVRIQDKYGDSWPEDAPFRPGQIWDMKYFAKNGRKPHVEDVMVNEYRPVGRVDDLKALVLRHARPWSGGCDVLFDRTVRRTPSGANYIPSSGKLPKCSTGYWIPDRDLECRAYGTRVRVVGEDASGIRTFPWVGAHEPPERIVAGELVRVSLSRRFGSESAPAGYYVQISGVM